MAKSEARSVPWSPQDEGTPRRTRIRQSLLAVAAVVMIGTIIVEGCARWEFRTFDPFQPPEIIPVFGRTYVRTHSEPTTLAEVRSTESSQPSVVLEPLIGSLPFIRPFDPPGPLTPTVIWLHLDGDRYISYEMVGGP